MPKKDLVKEFKNKVYQLEELTGFKYKILYRDYKGALENGRLHVFWHKPCKLAEVTTPQGKVSFEVAGELRMDLISPDGLVMTIEDYLSPLTPFDTTTIDDVGISHDGISVSNDKDVVKYSNPKKDWHFDIHSRNYVVATFNDKEHIFTDPSIAKDIFDIEAIKKLIEEDAAEEEVKPAEEVAEPAAPEVAEEPVAVEEVIEETAATEETTDEVEPEAVEEVPEEAVNEVAEPQTDIHDLTDCDFCKDRNCKDCEGGKDEPQTAEKVVEKENVMSPIKDSGNRTEFESGAVRDIQTGKGRCDLLPLDIVAEFFNCTTDKTEFEEIALFQETRDREHLVKAAKAFAGNHFDCDETAILEYACHMEDGCNKYGDRNWEKGIPLDRYVDSGIRHLLKCRRGDDDERHDRAFVWNMLCGAWTAKHHPELV